VPVGLGKAIGRAIGRTMQAGRPHARRAIVVCYHDKLLERIAKRRHAVLNPIRMRRVKTLTAARRWLSGRKRAHILKLVARKDDAAFASTDPRRARVDARPSVVTLRRKAHSAATLLHRQYGSPRHGNKDDPLDELVFILLSQMTTHHSFNRVFARLKQRAPTWTEVLAMPIHRLRALIKDAGLSNQKAPRIKAVLARVRKDFGTLTLDGLRTMSDAEATAYLTSLPGVGIKTAKCILMYSLGRAVLPVDTHVWRVARRLGVLDESVAYSRVHAVLEEVVAPVDRYSFHVNAVAHGRAKCLARFPRCDRCCLSRSCAYARAPRARTKSSRKLGHTVRGR
jgi:endonuclease III